MFISRKKEIEKLRTNLNLQMNNNKVLNSRCQKLAKENKELQLEILEAKKYINELLGELKKYMPKKANKK